MYKIDEAIYILMSGKIDPAEANRFVEDLSPKMDGKSQDLVIFDMRDAQGVNSYILGTIVRIWQQCKENGMTIRVIARRRVADLFFIARLETIVDLYVLDDSILAQSEE